ncbi:MAG: hypothetical protein O9341_23890 [Paucibacter sp.]|nr:hypothetical protein [Roseateles sp.]
MEPTVLVAVVGLVGGLVGSALGGAISFFSTTTVRKLEWRQALLGADVKERELLYSEFVAEASRLTLLSLDASKVTTQSTEFSKLAALEARIWFHSETLGKDARELARAVMREFPMAIMSKDGSSESAKDQPQFAEARDRFVAGCRGELQGLRANA